jgi:transcription initiation factor TFIIIB Brf1 subunit/transcription initiation factor TFIIB
MVYGNVSRHQPIKIEGKRHSSERWSSAYLLSFTSKLWRDDQGVAVAVAKESSRIIHIAYQRRPTFFSGKSAKGILAGLFYHLGYIHNSAKTQKQIAQSLNTTDMTVRSSCRDWTTYFPDLFRIHE